MTYDSRPDTLAHIDRVRWFIGEVRINLENRAEHHDASKLAEPEKSLFDEFTPKLRATTYGTPEYEAMRAAMGEALQHHYKHNSHHPEFYGDDGVTGMSLLDLIEMLADWKAATERHADGNLAKSLEINRARFDIDSQLYAILVNTVRELGW